MPEGPLLPAEEVVLRLEVAGAGAVCRAILAELPQWFGIPAAVEEYVAFCDRSTTIVASVGKRDVGFLGIARHSVHSAEVHVMGVLPDYHRRGVGRRLLEYCERFLVAEGVDYLQVKTLSSRREHEGYGRTRAFYGAMGFRLLEEFPLLWDPANPALQLVKCLRHPSEAGED
jgi:GNAT superfamily N-acetyltransferase